MTAGVCRSGQRDEADAHGGTLTDNEGDGGRMKRPGAVVQQNRKQQQQHTKKRMESGEEPAERQT